MVGVGADDFDVLTGDCLASFQIPERAVRLATRTALEQSVDDTDISVSVRCRASPVPGDACRCVDAMMHIDCRGVGDRKVTAAPAE